MVLVRGALERVLLMVVLWWVLTEGDPTTWTYAVALVPLATGTSLWLLPPRPRLGPPHRRAWALAQLVAWFLGRSVAGGVDVARRALSRPVDLAPGLVEHRLSLPAGLPRVAVADLTSLMPGTLSVALEGDVLTVHVLDTDLPVTAQLEELEVRVARVLGACSER
jgi:multicomponent Na+:H+ antiporter subunit E